MTADARPLAHLIVVSGSRIALREKHIDDARRDYDWRRDAELARYDGREPITESFDDYCARQSYDLRFQNPRERLLAIETIEGEHIGNVMYYNARMAQAEAEFGITIGRKDLHGGGLGTEATVMFLRHLWETTSFRSLLLHTFDWNERAARCFHRAGFEDVGAVERQAGRLLRMEARREWWLFHDSMGRFPAVRPDDSPPA